MQDVTDWDWRNGGVDDLGWWIQVEELRFLLPLLKSGKPEDLDLAGSWFRSWYKAEMSFEDSNMSRWTEPGQANLPLTFKI